MKHEFELNMRPRLRFAANDLRNVTSALAASPRKRQGFLQNPAGFLNQECIPVGECNLVKEALKKTSETVTPFVLCDISADCSTVMNVCFYVLVCAVVVMDTRTNIQIDGVQELAGLQAAPVKMQEVL